MIIDNTQTTHLSKMSTLVMTNDTKKKVAVYSGLAITFVDKVLNESNKNATRPIEDVINRFVYSLNNEMIIDVRLCREVVHNWYKAKTEACSPELLLRVPGSLTGVEYYIGGYEEAIAEYKELFSSMVIESSYVIKNN